MDDNEMMILLVFLGLGTFGWIFWYMRILAVSKLFSPTLARLPVLLAPPAGLCIIVTVLATLASRDVRDSPIYIFFYAAMGLGWVGGCTLIFPLLGLSPRTDVAERGNIAASLAMSGAIVGLSLCFAGGNIGDGPGWWVVVFASLISSGVLILFWALLGGFVNHTEILTVERDEAAGIRFCAFMAAAGLILGRAVAGDWESVADTVEDFAVQAWIVPIMLAAEAGASWFFRPTPKTPHPPVLLAGALPACAYVAVAALDILILHPLHGFF